MMEKVIVVDGYRSQSLSTDTPSLSSLLPLHPGFSKGTSCSKGLFFNIFILLGFQRVTHEIIIFVFLSHLINILQQSKSELAHFKLLPEMMRLLACSRCCRFLLITLFILSVADATNSENDPLVSKIVNKAVMSRLKRSEEGSVLYGSSSSNMPEDKMTSGSSDRWLDNTLSSIEVVPVGDENGLTSSKRGGGMDKFLGMRGKKEELGSKRGGPVEGFFGMRGKKFGMVPEGVKRLPGDVFYGMRGRKRAEVRSTEEKRKAPGDYFLGMRGKKSVTYGNDEDEQEESEGESMNEQKRTEPNANNNNNNNNNNRFLGMRGKKLLASSGSFLPSFSLPKYGMRSVTSDTSNEGNFRLMLNSSGRGVPLKANNDSWSRDKSFFRNLYLQKPSYFDHKRQVGNIFIGMRG